MNMFLKFLPLYVAVATALVPLENLSVDDTQLLLKSWNLDSAFGNVFAKHKLGGYALQLMKAEDIEYLRTDNGRDEESSPLESIPLHSKLLWHFVSKAKKDGGVPESFLLNKNAPGDSPRRSLASKPLPKDMKTFTGVRIKKDNSFLTMGAKEDVKIMRVGQNRARITASVNVDGVLNAKALRIDGQDVCDACGGGGGGGSSDTGEAEERETNPVIVNYKAQNPNFAQKHASCFSGNVATSENWKCHSSHMCGGKTLRSSSQDWEGCRSVCSQTPGCLCVEMKGPNGCVLKTGGAATNVRPGGTTIISNGYYWEEHNGQHFQPGCHYPKDISKGFLNHDGGGLSWCTKRCIESIDCTGFHLMSTRCQFCNDKLKGQKNRKAGNTLYYKVGMVIQNGGGGRRACVNEGYIPWKDSPKTYGTPIATDGNTRLFPQPIIACSASYNGLKGEGTEDGQHCYEAFDGMMAKQGNIVPGGTTVTMAGQLWEKHLKKHYDPGCVYPADYPKGFYPHKGQGAKYCAAECIKSRDCTGFHVRGGNCQFCNDALATQKARSVSIQCDLYFKKEINGWESPPGKAASAAFRLRSATTINAVRLSGDHPAKFFGSAKDMSLSFNADAQATVNSAGWKPVATPVVLSSKPGSMLVGFSPVKAGAVRVGVKASKGSSKVVRVSEVQVYGKQPAALACGYGPGEAVKIVQCSATRVQKGWPCQRLFDGTSNVKNNGWAVNTGTLMNSHMSKGKPVSVALAFDTDHVVHKFKISTAYDKCTNKDHTCHQLREFSLWYSTDAKPGLNSKWMPVESLRLQKGVVARVERNFAQVSTYKSEYTVMFPAVHATGIKLEIHAAFYDNIVLSEVTAYQCPRNADDDMPCGNDWFVFGQALQPNSFYFSQRQYHLGNYEMFINTENWSFSMSKWFKTLNPNTKVEIRFYDPLDPKLMDIRSIFKVKDYLNVDQDRTGSPQSTTLPRTDTLNIFDLKTKAYDVGTKMNRDFRLGWDDKYSAQYCSTRGMDAGNPNHYSKSFFSLFVGSGAYAHVVFCSWGLGHYNWQGGKNKDNNNDAGMRAAVALRLVDAKVGICDSNPCSGGQKCVAKGSDDYKCVVEKVFASQGKAQTFVVPDKVSSVEVLVYGAGGGGGDVTKTKGSNAAGGGGGFTSGVLKTKPKEKLTIIVGGGGSYNKKMKAAFGGGGKTGSGNTGAGGGRSAIQRSGKDLVSAGGGGGGGRGTKDGHGGGGGGLKGSAGDDPQGNGGGGGTQSSKGAGGKAEGSQYQGSYSTSAFCGGGGGGYYGGGACKTSNKGGGGGSSYIGGLITATAQTYSGMNGQDFYGGMSGAHSAAFARGVGKGGNHGSAGQNGRVIIRYTPPPTNELKEDIAGLYLSKPVYDDMGHIMGACGVKDRAFPVRDFKSETLLRQFLAKQKDGVYFVNSIAGPTPWAGSCAGSQSDLGYLKGATFAKFAGSGSKAPGVMKSKYKGNANCRCGSANPSWDPVVANVQKGKVQYPTGPKAGSVVFCHKDGYDTKRPVVCQKIPGVKTCGPNSVPDYATKTHCMPIVDYAKLKPRYVQAKDSNGPIPRSIQSVKFKSSAGANGIAVWRTPRSSGKWYLEFEFKSMKVLSNKALVFVVGLIVGNGHSMKWKNGDFVGLYSRQLPGDKSDLLERHSRGKGSLYEPFIPGTPKGMVRPNAVVGMAIDFAKNELTLYGNALNVKGPCKNYGGLSGLAKKKYPLDFSKGDPWYPMVWDGASSPDNHLTTVLRAKPRCKVPSGYKFWA